MLCVEPIETEASANVPIVIVARARMVVVTIRIMIPITVPMDAAALKAAEHLASDILSRVGFTPASSIVVTDSASQNDATIHGELVQRKGRRAGRKSDGAGGCK